MKTQLNQRKSVLAAFLLVMVLTAFAEPSKNAAGFANGGELKLQIQRATNSDELLLKLSGVDPKKYYILSTSGISNLTWSVEAVVDCAVSSSITLSVADRPQAFFKAISEDEFIAGNTSNIAISDKAGASATSRNGGKEWFVDRQNGHDGLDGHSKQRSTNNGPLATIKKAMTLSQSGDSVIIAGGAYTENLDLRGKNIAVKLEGNVILH